MQYFSSVYLKSFITLSKIILSKYGSFTERINYKQTLNDNISLSARSLLTLKCFIYIEILFEEWHLKYE